MRALLRLGRLSRIAIAERRAPSSYSLRPSRKPLASITQISPEFSACIGSQAARFFSSATSAARDNPKDGNLGTSTEEGPNSDDKTDPVSKSEDVKTVEGAAQPAKAGKAAETQEQKLLREVKKLEQLVREKDSVLEEKDDMVKELKDNVLRSYAELENYRERASREAENTRKFSVQGFSKALLDVADNLERALSSVPENYDSKSPEELKKLFSTMVEGVKMTEKELVRVYKKHGVQRFDPAGQPFDPNVHLAVCEIADSTKSPGTVAMVFKAGYMLHERVLRPAEVGVVKAEDEPNST